MFFKLNYQIMRTPSIAARDMFDAIPCFQGLNYVLIRNVIHGVTDKVTAKNNNVIVGLMTQCKKAFPTE